MKTKTTEFYSKVDLKDGPIFYMNGHEKNELSFDTNLAICKFLGFTWNGASKTWYSRKEPKSFEVKEIIRNSQGESLLVIIILEDATNLKLGAICAFDDKEVARKNGFQWDPKDKIWAKEVQKEKEVSQEPEKVFDFDDGIQDLLKTKLFDYQKEGIAKMLSKRVFLNGDQMGLGKTLQAIGAVVKGLEVNKKVLVICPAFLKFNWMAEFKKHCVNEYKTKILTSKNFEIDDDNQVFIINYDILTKMDSFKAFDAIICDEAHALKSTKNKRVDAFKKMFKDFEGSCYFLTGTPIKNRVPELYNFFNWALNYHMESYQDFCECYAYKKTFKIGRVQITKYEGLKNADDLQKRMKPWFIKRETKDVLDLPELQRIDVFSDVEKKKDLDIFKDLEAAFDDFMEGKGKGEHIMHIRQKASMLKVGDTVSQALEILDQSESLVVFESFVEPSKLIFEALSKEYKEKIAFIDGSISMETRQRIVEQFQSGEILCIVATIGALSTGVTLTAASKMIFNSLSWVPADNMQAEKRIHRIGTTEKCFIYRMLKTEFDANICKMLSNKENVIERAGV